MAAAILGDATGYWIGFRAGMAIYNRPDSFFFRRKHLAAAHAFYEKHGGKTIILARFMPIIRTFAPVVAGAGTMSYRRFAAYNVVGGIGWVASMTLTGYFLGRAVPNLDKHLHELVALVIFLSLLPGIIAYLRERFGKSKTLP
jgi:membrane-associated protein